MPSGSTGKALQGMDDKQIKAAKERKNMNEQMILESIGKANRYFNVRLFKFSEMFLWTNYDYDYDFDQEYNK